MKAHIHIILYTKFSRYVNISVCHVCNIVSLKKSLAKL